MGVLLSAEHVAASFMCRRCAVAILTHAKTRCKSGQTCHVSQKICGMSEFRQTALFANCSDAVQAKGWRYSGKMLRSVHGSSLQQMICSDFSTELLFYV